MGNHRADVHADIPSVTPPPYVGKRRALPSTEPAVEAPSTTPYVGKRRATPVADAAGHGEPVSRPMPTRLVLREPILDRDHHERADEDERITTGELRALVDATLEDTAPRLRLDGPAAAPAGLSVPGPRRTPEQVPPTAPEPEPVPARPLFAPATSAIELPRLSVAATYAADLTGDTTMTLPAVSAGGNGGRRRSSGRRSLLKGMPSLPAAVGACALAAAVVGAVATHPGTSDVTSTRVTTATALTGASEIAGVDNGREVPVSRGGGRGRSFPGNAAQVTADKRAQALTQLNAQANSQDAFILKNQWGLPILAHEYHLTGRFGDVSGLWATVHTGLDFAAPYGTPIHAVARGVVTSTGYDGSYGNKTVVTLPDGTELWYCHQSQFGTSVGDTVNEGQVIGYVGATGNVTGPHVHLEVRPGGGDPVDPDAALKAHGIDPDANQ